MSDKEDVMGEPLAPCIRPAVISVAAAFYTLGLRWGDNWTPIFHGPPFIVVPREADHAR